ncbi:MAG: hypothetical protein U0640_15855 [Phycisphaerales bacterium]
MGHYSMLSKKSIVQKSLHAMAWLGPIALSCSAACAITSNTARVDVLPDFSGGTGPYTQSVTQAGAADASGSTTGGFNSAGSASSHVQYGLIQVFGQGSGSINSVGRGECRDVITISAPGVAAGTAGTLTYRVRVSGFINASSGSSGCTWTLQTDVGGGASDIIRTATYYSPSFPNSGYTGDAMGTYSATIAFQFGTPLQLALDFQGTADAANQSLNNTGNANFGSPLEMNWLGITNVTANSQPVPNFTVASVSGTNWAIDLTPQSCDSIDFNNDSSLFDPQDIDAFLSVYSEGPCIPATATCNDIDFNNDGSLFDPCDIDSFLLVFSEGPCTLCGQ